MSALVYPSIIVGKNKLEDQSPRAIELRERLEYMVFAKERREISAELSHLLQQKINLDPYNGKLWRELLYVSQEADLAPIQREQMLAAAHALLQWNYKEQAVLANQCILAPAEVSENWMSICRELLGGLVGRIKQTLLLRYAQVTQRSYLTALNRYGVSAADGERK